MKWWRPGRNDNLHSGAPFHWNHKENDEMGMPGPALNDHVGVGVDTPFHSKTLGKQWNGDDRFRPRDRHLTLNFIEKH